MTITLETAVTIFGFLGTILGIVKYGASSVRGLSLMQAVQEQQGVEIKGLREDMSSLHGKFTGFVTQTDTRIATLDERGRGVARRLDRIEQGR